MRIGSSASPFSMCVALAAGFRFLVALLSAWSVAGGWLPHAAAADKTVVNVFLLAGQSNMAGADSEVAVPPGFQQTAADRATRFTMAPLPDGEKSPQYVPWGEIKGHQAKNKLVHGPEVGFARALFAAGWRDVAIIKVHANFRRDAQSWPWREGGEFFEAWAKFVDARLAEITAQGHAPRVCGFVWHQGIDDAIHGKLASQYERNLSDLIGVLRKRYAAEQAPFVLARSVNSRIAQPQPDPESKSPMAMVRRAQVKVGESVPSAAWIDVDDLPNVNTHHFSADSQLVIGQRFGEAFLRLQKKAHD
jgi:Carbohydrate esterase, sialic acid-specific acetylesterase